MSDDATTTPPSGPTTPDGPASTFSDETVPSSAVSPRLALGREIVLALSGDRAGVLERWMAHHIAELMGRAEEAELGPERDAAAAACRTAILDAWSKRQSWPYGAPLERVASALSAIAGPPDDAWKEQDRPDPAEGWFSLFNALDAVEWEEHQIVLDTGAAAMDLDAERGAMEAAGDDLGEHEREILALFEERHEQAGSPDFKLGRVDAPEFRDLPVEEQVNAVRRAFEAAARRRQEALERVIKALSSPPSSGTGGA